MTASLINHSLISKLEVSQLIKQTAARTPVPGGGSISAITGSLAAALGTMAATYSRVGAREKDLERLAQQLLKLADKDQAAYQKLSNALKTRERAPKRFEKAVIAALAVPMAVMEKCAKVLSVLEACAGDIKPALHSDLAISASMAQTALEGAWHTAKANLSLLGDADHKRRAQSACKKYRRQGNALKEKISRKIKSK